MLPRIVAFVLTLAWMAAPLQAQRGAVERPRTPDANITRGMDARLIATPALADTRVHLGAYMAVSDTLARPRWHYPAMGAVIGLAAGVIHAKAATRGDYVGLPVEPMYVLPPVYAAAGGFVGYLLDSADRRRNARRD